MEYKGIEGKKGREAVKNLIAFIGLAILLTGCSPETESPDTTRADKISEQEETINSLQNEIERMEQKVTDYEKTAEKVVNILNEKQLQQLAEAQWNYQLSMSSRSKNLKMTPVSL
ncbi:hypothetical protein [Salibacterium aidingense]|uniref:hypothetical protein n=1 Tax=Salibacterium aidingense TaxID=384933 RepID=UPI0012EBCF76|nr:hypothetical protein [Salibacterium aidingense]